VVDSLCVVSIRDLGRPWGGTSNPSCTQSTPCSGVFRLWRRGGSCVGVCTYVCLVHVCVL
jgi:hypothetical protein